MQWAQKINPLYSGYPNDIVIDNNNNIFVTGSLQDYVGSAGDGLFIAKYNTSGTQVWYNTYGFNVSFVRDAYGIAVDNLGNLLISGRYMQTITLGSITLNAPPTFGNLPGFICKLDANGNVIWANQLTSPGQVQDELESIAVDAANNIYTVGDVDSTATVGNITIPRSSGNKLIIIKYDPIGNPLWAKASTNKYQYNQSRIMKGIDNNMYISGCYYDTLQIDTFVTISTGSHNNAFIMRLDTSGTDSMANGIWSRRCQWHCIE